MDLLINHGTWIIVPIGLFVAFVYFHVFPKIALFLLARRLPEEDGCQGSTRTKLETTPTGGHAAPRSGRDARGARSSRLVTPGLPRGSSSPLLEDHQVYCPRLWRKNPTSRSSNSCG